MFLVLFFVVCFWLCFEVFGCFFMVFRGCVGIVVISFCGGCLFILIAR